MIIQPLAQAALGRLPVAPPCVLVLFGAAGDLTKRLLMPALYNLAGAGLLDERFRVLGLDHNRCSEAEWRAELSAAMQSFTKDPSAEFYTEHVDEEAWDWVVERLDYLTADFTDAQSYAALAERLGTLAHEIGNGNAVFYLATAPHFFAPVAEALAKQGLLAERDGFRRLIVEKPFGEDRGSARELARRLRAAAAAPQIYPIDHWLGKETVQNIMALRFAGRVFAPVWNAEHISHVEITAAETIGVEDRGRFYEPTGALRDMVPNHLFQLLALTSMEPPQDFSADAVRDAKRRMLEALLPADPREAVRGQYGAGSIGGAPARAYREEPNVGAASRTETYVALRLASQAPRWRGVDFYLRTGKRLAARRTEIALHLKAPATALAAASDPESAIILAVDPEQGVKIEFAAKRPGPAMRLAQVAADFRYGDYFEITPAVGYETLLYDCMRGDPMLFASTEMIDAAWAAVQPLLDAWAKGGAPELYAAGSDGPASAATLLARCGRQWRPLED